VRSTCVGALAFAGVWVALGLPASAGAGASSPAAESAKRLPSRMLVTASEWSYVLSRTKLRPGPAIIELYNRGEDPHNLRIRRADGKGRIGRIGKAGADEGARLEFRLKRGRRYRLWCSLPTHRKRGMKATLKVRRKR
jgi:hypothetical protein